MNYSIDWDGPGERGEHDGRADLPDLMPCPFCGDDGEKNIFTHHKALPEGGGISVTKVQCLRCAAEAPLAGWNRRRAGKEKAGG